MNNELSSSDNRLTPAQAAAFISCSEYKIRELARQKQIPHYRIGNRILFCQTSLSKWIADQEKENYNTVA